MPDMENEPEVIYAQVTTTDGTNVNLNNTVYAPAQAPFNAIHQDSTAGQSVQWQQAPMYAGRGMSIEEPHYEDPPNYEAEEMLDEIARRELEAERDAERIAQNIQPAPYPANPANMLTAAARIGGIGGMGGNQNKKAKKPMPNIKDADIVIVASSDDSVEDMLLRAFEFLPVKIPCHFHLREMSREDCFSHEAGREIGCWQWTIDSASLSRLAGYISKDGEVTDNAFFAQAASMERHIGVPALTHLTKSKIESIRAGITVRPLDEIMARLLKFRKKANRELKDMRQIYPDIDEPQSPKLLGAISTLTWLFNNGNIRPLENVLHKLRSLVITREREKLFYYLRHPDNPAMHKPQDFEVLESIAQMHWYFNGVNPFNNIGSYGYASYR